MIKLFAFVVSFSLIGIIFIRVPKESVGLTKVGPKNSFLDSSSSSERFLNIVTILGIFIYLGIAIRLNF